MHEMREFLNGFIYHEKCVKYYAHKTLPFPVSISFDMMHLFASIECGLFHLISFHSSIMQLCSTMPCCHTIDAEQNPSTHNSTQSAKYAFECQLGCVFVCVCESHCPRSDTHCRWCIYNNLLSSLTLTVSLNAAYERQFEMHTRPTEYKTEENRKETTTNLTKRNDADDDEQQQQPK